MKKNQKSITTNHLIPKEKRANPKLTTISLKQPSRRTKNRLSLKQHSRRTEDLPKLIVVGDQGRRIKIKSKFLRITLIKLAYIKSTNYGGCNTKSQKTPNSKFKKYLFHS